MNIKGYDPDRDEIRIRCENCKTETTHTVGDANMDYLEEFKQFSNPVFACPACPSVTAVNINIPVFEEEEIEAMELDMPPEEIVSRSSIRGVMWRKRPDLKNKDREKERKKYVDENGDRIKRERENVERIRKERPRRF